MIKSSALLAVVLALNLMPKSLEAKPNNGGGGKYAKCKGAYDTCVGNIVFSPGSQSYNVAKSRCYSAWKSCVGLAKSSMGADVQSDDSIMLEPEHLEGVEFNQLEDNTAD